MNKYVVVTLLLSCLACSSPTCKNKSNTSILFKEKLHDFGKLITGEPAAYQFKFTNSGKTPIILCDVKPSCGCTVAKWTRSPVKPGDSGFIEINFNAAFAEVFTKDIKVHYNGVDSPVTLSIQGEVQESDSSKNENCEE